MLDFTSLYPSVIITHNICYPTIINQNDIKKYPSDSYHTIDIRNNKSILPRLMKILLTECIRYKNLMKNAQECTTVIYWNIDSCHMKNKNSNGNDPDKERRR
ncbi:hypothetical protein H8356DRAFT_1330976 [Neocallimastix lanati (nom. inval.)]|nr:hypothetical protein H8356DRAFT_1330976 [Neocallimastix sp. JGI-2020a]